MEPPTNLKLGLVGMRGWPFPHRQACSCALFIARYFDSPPRRPFGAHRRTSVPWLPLPSSFMCAMATAILPLLLDLNTPWSDLTGGLAPWAHLPHRSERERLRCVTSSSPSPIMPMEVLTSCAQAPHWRCSSCHGDNGRCSLHPLLTTCSAKFFNMVTYQSEDRVILLKPKQTTKHTKT
jgi:hypothetical protein